MTTTRIKLLEKELKEVRKKANALKKMLLEQDRNPNANNDYKCFQQQIAKIKNELVTIEVALREKEAKRLERIGMKEVVWG